MLEIFNVFENNVIACITILGSKYGLRLKINLYEFFDHLFEEVTTEKANIVNVHIIKDIP